MKIYIFNFFYHTLTHSFVLITLDDDDNDDDNDVCDNNDDLLRFVFVNTTEMRTK